MQAKSKSFSLPIALVVLAGAIVFAALLISNSMTQTSQAQVASEQQTQAAIQLAQMQTSNAIADASREAAHRATIQQLMGKP